MKKKIFYRMYMLPRQSLYPNCFQYFFPFFYFVMNLSLFTIFSYTFFGYLFYFILRLGFFTIDFFFFDETKQYFIFKVKLERKWRERISFILLSFHRNHKFMTLFYGSLCKKIFLVK